MTLLRPFYMQAGGADATFSYDAINDRNMLRSLIRSEGVMTPDVVAGGLKVTQRGAGADFSVDIAAGRAAVMGDDVTDQGVYIVRSSATENRAIPSPPATGSRTHRVVAQVMDRLYVGSYADYTWDIVVLEDTGSGTPAVPASAISLARVTVAAGQTSVTNANIADDRTTANLITSKFPLVDADASLPPNPYSGEIVWRTDMSCLQISDGSFWYEIVHKDAGSGGPYSGSEWPAYDPVLTATTTNPNMGVGATKQGWFYWSGAMVYVTVIMKFGTSGTSAGSGIYEVSLPTPAVVRSVGRRTGTCYAYQHTNAYSDGGCFIQPGEDMKVRLSIDSTVVTNSSPWGWTANDEFGFSIFYEAAP